ncbi:tRNA (adenosine(37)-N6)-dimethylallyltransferase MiaA [Nitratifractor salsuginis]|uniref:tRNA dimethylallyltransferase n=1 Tax=Nitratifractor salsuginis (strain DSM 16511 / JCM 12458 / E9I37-1) TaxID=749222 RepID=E6WYS4_NITSE|nr:tRNA (adenosine(37)-N6)-dimethylallyltransferase MiaA [Nitratifractor salsuginis]ADV45445.1 tRNA delta(2)-isopentenylpyrophosphate transferase [Nitratifractor salsuginis DSM 16511]
MKDPLKQIALIGPTASGKSALALELAERFHGYILSIDSLAIYKEIDIASAKPTREELARVPHFGIDLLRPDEPFDVTRFIALYKQAARQAALESKPLILVGGSSFYLKALIDGVSPLPEISEETSQTVDRLLQNLSDAYRLLQERAPHTAARISPQDRYRIEKSLLILLETDEEPLEYFKRNPPVSPVSLPLPLYEVSRERSELRERIALRTTQMLEKGLIDEVARLESHYGRAPQSMKAIGIAEVLDYFDGRLNRCELAEKITTNTARLAKRQSTFNRSQFVYVRRDVPEALYREISDYFGKES